MRRRFRSASHRSGTAFPAAFLARAPVERLPVRVNTAILDAVVLFGGVVMVAGALR